MCSLQMTAKGVVASNKPNDRRKTRISRKLVEGMVKPSEATLPTFDGASRQIIAHVSCSELGLCLVCLGKLTAGVLRIMSPIPLFTGVVQGIPNDAPADVPAEDFCGEVERTGVCSSHCESPRSTADSHPKLVQNCPSHDIIKRAHWSPGLSTPLIGTILNNTCSI